MKYVNKLNHNKILELVKIYTGDSFRSLVELTSTEDSIEVTVEVEVEDDRDDGKTRILLEESYVLYDYDVEILDYYTTEEKELLRMYREKNAKPFWEEYALDYLLMRA